MPRSPLEATTPTQPRAPHEPDSVKHAMLSGRGAILLVQGFVPELTELSGGARECANQVTASARVRILEVMGTR